MNDPHRESTRYKMKPYGVLNFGACNKHPDKWDYHCFAPKTHRIKSSKKRAIRRYWKKAFRKRLERYLVLELMEMKEE